MKTVNINIYEFKELSDTAKAKVLIDLAEINFHYNWWDFILEDAETVGLVIPDFDIDLRQIRISFSGNSPMMCAREIVRQHGDETGTYKAARQFLSTYKDDNLKYEGTSPNVQTFIDALSKEYLTMLRAEYEYRYSEKAIIESIESNEYWFTETGEIFNIKTN